MNLLRLPLSLLMALGLAACAGPQPASRGMAQPEPGLSLLAPADVSADIPAGVVVMQPKYRVAEVRVSVPRSLTASEANTFHPNADIVWRGDPRGDRHVQVTQLFNAALIEGTAGMAAGPEVVVEVVVTRFHCLTEKTRYTVGGVHSMKFDLTVRDKATGAILEGPRPVVADVKASGGAAAIAEDQAGRTQKVVVIERLSEVIRRELSAPVSGPAAEAALVSRFRGNMAITATGLGL